MDAIVGASLMSSGPMQIVVLLILYCSDKCSKNGQSFQESLTTLQGIAGATDVVNGPSTRSRRRVTMFSGRLVAVTWAGEQSRCDEVIVWFFSGGGSRDAERPNAGCYVESCGGVMLAMCESATCNLSRVASATCPPGRKVSAGSLLELLGPSTTGN